VESWEINLDEGLLQGTAFKEWANERYDVMKWKCTNGADAMDILNIEDDGL